MNELNQLLKDLVAINSINPDLCLVLPEKRKSRTLFLSG
jgi:hypothetical protein